MSKNTDIGSLKHTVTFKKTSGGSLGLGRRANYQPFLTTRCSKEKKRANKQNESGQVLIGSFWIMRCRFEIALLDQLDGSVICEIDGDEYTIHDFDLVEEKKHLYEFTLSKSVA
jgi:hypothetical protein